MKKTNLMMAVGLSLIGLGLSAVPAKAASYANGNLLLGFYATGGEGSNTSLVLNIGPASTYRDAPGEFFLSVGSIAGDLVETFGPDWHSRDDVFWGVFGSTYNATVGADGPWTIYGVRAQTTPGTQSQPYNRGSVHTQSQPGTKIKDLGDAYALTGSATGLTAGINPATSVQNASADNDFAEYQSNQGGTSFGYFNSSLANFADGVGASRVDLFRMETGPSAEKGSYEGTFTIGTNGVVRYSTVPNPEPTPTPAPTPTVDPTPEPPSKAASIQKKISKIKKQLKAVKKISDPAKKKKKTQALKKKLKKLQQQLKSA